MPAKAAAIGESHNPCPIPDGFYLVGDSSPAVQDTADKQAAFLKVRTISSSLSLHLSVSLFALN
jgi:hypothetical protein